MEYLAQIIVCVDRKTVPVPEELRKAIERAESAAPPVEMQVADLAPT